MAMKEDQDFQEGTQPSISFDPETVPESIALDRNNPEWEQHLIQLINERRDDELIKFVEDLYTPDLAHLIERLDFEDGLYLFNRLELETRGLVLIELEIPLKQKIVRSFSPEEIASIIREQESTEAAELLSDLELNQVSEVLSRMPLDERVDVTELLSYPEYTAGAMMAKEFVAVQEKSTVKHAIRTIRKISRETDDIHTVFVIDEEGKYRGHIDLSRLILSNPATRIKRITETELLPIPVHTDQEEVAHFFTRYDFITVPVVDSRGVMLGRITVDDVLEVIQEEASEDILRMGGVGESETLATPVFRASFRRVLWLLVNLLTAFLASSVVRLFETTISEAVILAALMPIVAGMGGNAAGQTMAVIIRNIALGELGSHNAKKVLLREFSLGVLNGIMLGLTTGLVVYLISGLPVLGLVMGSAMLFNMMVAATAGTVIPLGLKRWNIDPAIASSIFVTTATDVLGFFIFLGLAFLTLPYIH